MARYAEWNKFIGNLKTDKYGATNVNEVGIAFEKATADVVPKTEIAREIFEEIERFLYLHFRFCKEEIGNDDTECVKGRMELNTQIQNFIAELKKKYTEANDEEKS